MHTNSELSFHSLSSSISICLFNLLKPCNSISELLLERFGLCDHRLLISSSGSLGTGLKALDGSADRVCEFICFSHQPIDLAVGCLAVRIVGDIVERAVMKGIEPGYIGVQGVNCVCYIRTLPKVSYLFPNKRKCKKRRSRRKEMDGYLGEEIVQGSTGLRLGIVAVHFVLVLAVSATGVGSVVSACISAVSTARYLGVTAPRIRIALTIIPI